MRNRLPNRRESTVLNVYHGWERLHVRYSRGANGKIAEVFVHGPKAGSDAAATLASACTVISIALQYGVPLEEMCHSTPRLETGEPADVIGLVLDTLRKENANG